MHYLELIITIIINVNMIANTKFEMSIVIDWTCLVTITIILYPSTNQMKSPLTDPDKECINLKRINFSYSFTDSPKI